jgi:hypothetical protein
VFYKLGEPEGEPPEARLPKRGYPSAATQARLPKQGKQRVSRPKRRYPTTGKRRRLCHSMASDSLCRSLCETRFKLLREGKVWEIEAEANANVDAESGRTIAGVESTRI